MTGADFVEMKDSDRCCGMAGAFGVKIELGALGGEPWLQSWQQCAL